MGRQPVLTLILPPSLITTLFSFHSPAYLVLPLFTRSSGLVDLGWLISSLCHFVVACSFVALDVPPKPFPLPNGPLTLYTVNAYSLHR